MDCEGVERLLSGKPYAELPAKQQAEVVGHVAECAACRARWLADPGTQELTAAVRSVSPRKSVKAQVMDRLEHEASQGGGDAASADAGPARTIGGFHLIGRIGQGGMGTVYKARQVSMDRIVALKVLSSRLAEDEPFVQRFLREARSTAQLNHPNIVQGIDAGFADGHYYFAMEYVDGITVRRLMAKEGKIEEAKALKIILGVAKALEHAHKHGIVHRDIKPENIMISRGGLVKLADLGLARSFSEPDTVTMHGATLGTPYYMSPEQARGLEDIDTRSDIYALGATLFHMLTGEFPFEGPTPAVILAKHITEEAPSPKSKNPALSTHVCDLIRRMMAKDPSRRPHTPTLLIVQIRDILEGISLTPPSMTAATAQMAASTAGARREPAEDARPAKQLSPMVWVGVAGLLLVGTVAFYWITRGSGGDRREEARSAYNSASVYYRDHVDDLDAAASRFREVVTRYPDTEHAKKAREELAAIEKKMRAPTGAQRPRPKTETPPQPKVKEPSPEDIAFQGARKRLEGLLGRKDFKGAAEAVASEASSKRLPPARINELRRYLLSSVGRAVKEMDTQADALCREGKHKEAAGLYQAALAWGIDEVRSDLEDGIARAEQAEKEAQEAATAQAKASYTEAFDKQVRPLLAERRYEEAAKALDGLSKREGFRLAEEDIELSRKDIARLRTFWRSVEKTASDLKLGQRIRVKGMQVPFRSYGAGTVRYTLGAAEAGIALSKMTPKDIFALLGEGFFRDDETRLQGVLFLVYDREPDLAGAKALLSEVGPNADAERYLGWTQRPGAGGLGAGEETAGVASHEQDHTEGPPLGRKPSIVPAAKESVLRGKYQGPLKIGPGRYRVEGRVVCEKGLRLRPGTEVVFAGSAAKLWVGIAFVAEGTARKRIRIVGHGTAPKQMYASTQEALKMQYCDLVDVDMWLTLAEKVTISRCRFSRCGLQGYTSGAGTFISDCVFEDMKSFSILSTGGSSDPRIVEHTRVSGCRIKALSGVTFAVGGPLRLANCDVDCQTLSIASYGARHAPTHEIVASRIKSRSLALEAHKGSRVRFRLTRNTFRVQQIHASGDEHSLLALTCERNDFLDLVSFSVSCEKGVVLRAPNNYWGTTNEGAIRQKIRTPQLTPGEPVIRQKKIRTPQLTFKPFATTPFSNRVGPEPQ
ncbi:protein kinase [Planctomycetota bacterium]